MNTDFDLPIVTNRLLLRPFELSDRPAYDAYHCRPDVYRFLYMPVPTGQALDAQFLSVLPGRFTEDGDTFRLAVTRKDDAVVLGEVLLKIANKAALQGEVGYIFNPDFAGKGYATEAVQAMLDIGFRKCGFHRIFARLDPLNTGSVGVMERLRFRREAHLIHNDRFEGSWGDEFIYALVRSEWEKVAS